MKHNGERNSAIFKEEIIEKYQRHIDNYENIIVELEIFENSVYVKEKI